MTLSLSQEPGVTSTILNNILQTRTELTDIDEEFLQLPSMVLTVTNFTFQLRGWIYMLDYIQGIFFVGAWS